MAEPAEARVPWRLGFLYAALFLVVGCDLPYLPIWLHWRDLDADQIAVLLATPLFIRILFTPAISFAADLLGGRRAILIALAWGSLVSFLLLWAADGFWQSRGPRLGGATIASGPLYRTFAGEAYGAMTCLALIGAGCAFLLMRRWRGGLVVGAVAPQPQSSGSGGKTWPAA